MTERKFVDLKALKVSGDGPGTIEGYRSVFGEIDEGGDVIVKGAFLDCIPEYLRSGFTAESHEWDFSKAVGFPLEAKEDEHGWFVRSQFHSTQDAQNIRTKAQERFDNGLQVGFSFGYKADEFQYVEQKDYKDQLPQFIKPERLEENLKKAQRYPRIRVLKKVSAIEDSLVTAPMNKLAGATAVKSVAEFKGMLEEEMAQDDPSFWRAESAFCRLVQKIAESAKNAVVLGNEFDWQGRIDSISAELGSEAAKAAKAQVQEFLDGSDEEFYLKGIAGTESFESFEDAGAALAKFAQKMRSNHEIRLKEGRVLSSSNRAKVQSCKEAMTALIADLDDLLSISEPKPKEKGIDVESLRIQSLRIRSQALSALS